MGLIMLGLGHAAESTGGRTSGYLLAERGDPSADQEATGLVVFAWQRYLESFLTFARSRGN